MLKNFIVINLDFVGRELAIKNPYEREVFSHIYSMTNLGKGHATLSVRKIASYFAYSKSTIAKAVNALLAKGYIVKDDEGYRSIVWPKDKEQPASTSVPIMDTNPQDAQPTVPNMATAVPNTDTDVPNLNDTVQESDFLPPTTPINNKIKNLSPNIKLGDETKQQHLSFFEDLNLSDSAPTPSPAPKKPAGEAHFFSDEDKAQDYLRRGIHLAKVVQCYAPKSGEVIKYVTLREAQEFDLNIVTIIPATSQHTAAGIPHAFPLSVLDLRNNQSA